MGDGDAAIDVLIADKDFEIKDDIVVDASCRNSSKISRSVQYVILKHKKKKGTRFSRQSHSADIGGFLLQNRFIIHTD